MRLIKPLVRIVLILSFLSSFHASLATHVVGGDLGYRYLGETAPGTGQYRYKLILRLYLNCGVGSSFPSIINLLDQPGDGMPIGVYTEDPNNPNASKNLFTTGYAYITTYNVITPDLPDNCSLGEGQCVEQSLLEGEVILPASTSGYHLYYQLFARNEAIDNLNDPGGTGIGFYSFIPPTDIANSSPVFVGTPVPFICVGDTTAFSNAATDPDGDSLVFSFETPYASQDEAGGIMPPPAPLNWPIIEVAYNGGYSAVQPFGAGGYASIDPVTGATEYVADMIGNWVVAVEVKEYRNGQLIGRIRSDLQLLSTPCSANIAPVPQGGQITTSYDVIAGDQLCFPLAFTDENGDTLNLDVNGVVFDANLFNPPAQVSGQLTGDSLMVSQFCWSTVCGQASDEAYYFSVLVYDDACPPGVYSAVIAVHVIPSEVPPTIEGSFTPCANQTFTYCTPELSGSTYSWSASGGTITSATNEPCATVTWGATGVGQITVSRTEDGCTLETVQGINIMTSPTAAFTVEFDTTCTGIKTYVIDQSSGSAASAWSLNGSPVPSGIEGPQIILPFGANNVIGLTMTDQNGCVATAETTVAVGAYSELVHYGLPNVFTPNGDNVNDRFELVTTQILDECFTVQIFDRWGNRVYESGSGAFAWNGKRDNGEPADEGVYYYILSVKDDEYHGHISLMR